MLLKTQIRFAVKCFDVAMGFQGSDVGMYVFCKSKQNFKFCYTIYRNRILQGKISNFEIYLLSRARFEDPVLVDDYLWSKAPPPDYF